MTSRALNQELLVGLQLGHYQLLEKIGCGGMGEVYRARDQHLDRDVAIKVLPPGALTDERARKHFRREALILSRLNHSNIATIHDFDTQGGVDFLVMEFIPGITISEKTSGKSLPEKEVLRLGAQLAEGLTAAHDRGIVHRDLKPGNLRLTTDGLLKILDFGLAELRLPVTEDAPTESLAETRAIAGTVPYMAPEQLLGRDADARTDIYGAGTVLYELATGERPFGKLEHAQLITAILQRTPRPPSQLNPKLTAELERIIGKCLEKEPENRYQSARELAIDLRRLQTNTSSGLESPVMLARRGPGFVRLAAGLAAVIVIVIAVAIGGWRDRWLHRVEAPHFASLAVLPLENLSGDPRQEYFADGMTESLITDLGRLTGLKGVIARGSVMRYKGSTKPVVEIGRELNVDAIITGAVLRSGNRLRVTAQLVNAASGKLLWSEHYERDLTDVLQLQNEVTRSIASEIRVQLTANDQARLASVRAVNAQAYDAYLMGRYHWFKMTPPELDQAAEYFQIALDNDPNYAAAYAAMGEVWGIRAHTGLLPMAQGYAKERAAALKALELDSTASEAHEVLAAVLTWYDWDWAAGEREYRRAIELNPNFASAHCFYSFFLHAMRRSREARSEIERALELDPYNSLFHVALSKQLSYGNQPAEAMSGLQRAAALEPDSLFVHGDLWALFAQNREYEKAEAEAIEYFKLLRAQDVVKALKSGYAQGGYRGAMLRAGNTMAARSRQGSASTMDVAFLYAYAGENDRALDWLEKAYEEHASRLPYINVLTQFDTLRSHPRFQELVRRMNFPRTEALVQQIVN